MTAIDDKYAELGGAGGVLGNPTTGEHTCADGKGHYRHFENGSIFWHPLTGAQAMALMGELSGYLSPNPDPDVR